MVALARCSAVLALPTLLVCLNTSAAEEPAIAGEGKSLEYLQAVHAKIHPAWALNFLPMATSQLPKDDPVNNPSREATLEVTISPTGALLDARVLKGSQVSGFDNSAIDVVKSEKTFAPPPVEILSDDGNAHLYWTFARDGRQCSGVKVARKEAPLPQAMALLVKRGRVEDALARAQNADDDERDAAVTAFAKEWLRSMESDPTIGPDATIALARGGEQEAAGRLGKMLAAHPKAARGLAALNVPVCPLVKDRLPAADPASRQAVLQALRYGAGDDCLEFLVTTAKNAQVPIADRLMAIEGLGHSDTPQAQASLRGMAKEPNPAVLAAALLAESRPDGGKSAIFRLTPMLRNPAVAVRAAAAAALVRAGGEGGLSQLFLIFKEKTPAPYVLVSAELARLSGQASAGMLEKFLRKSDVQIRVAAARALASRTDEFAAQALSTIAPQGNAELTVLAALAKDTTADLGALPLSEETQPTFAVLLSAKRYAPAARALLEGFLSLPPRLRAEFLGEWLAAQAQTGAPQ